MAALEQIDKVDGDGVFVLRDFHDCWGNAAVRRKLRSVSGRLKFTKRTILVTWPGGPGAGGAEMLTWMQEKTAPVFVVATANEVRSPPPELLRKGRCDEIFFLDLPTSAERREIHSVHLRERRRR